MKTKKGKEISHHSPPLPKDLTQVVILCGGRGTRLKPLTDDIPKALVHVKKRPILDYVLDFYRSKGFSRFTLCVGYKGEKIKEYYSDKRGEGKIVFSDAGESASMLERIAVLKDSVEKTFFVSYGDTLVDLDTKAMMDFHQKQQASTTIVTAKIRSPFGLVDVDGQGWVTSFVEKPLLSYYIGSFVMDRSALTQVTDAMRQKSDGTGLVEFFMFLAKQKKLAVFEHQGAQLTFNTESERLLAEESLGKFYTYSEKEIKK